MSDVRLLSLHKQYYLAAYPKELPSQYSSVGYYDGFSIESINDNCDSFNGNNPLARLWHKEMSTLFSQNAQYSMQNVGIFRFETDSDHYKHFWNDGKYMPYFAVAFIQLKDKLNYQCVKTTIETSNVDDQSPSHRLCHKLVYYTFDNADLVLLMNGNSICLIEDELKKLESDIDIAYTYSIFGISEEFLHEYGNISEGEYSSFKYHNIDCFLDEEIDEVQLNIDTSDPEKINAIQSNFNDRGLAFKSLYTNGHANVIGVLSNLRVHEFIRLLIPKAPLTHQSSTYGKVVYNIETKILKKYCSQVKGNENQTLKENSPPSWCLKKLKEYQQYMRTAQEKNDYCLFSYFGAAIKTLNSLSQYEQFEIAEDVFFSVAHTFKIFDERLRKYYLSFGFKQLQEESFKQTFCEFLEYVNSIIYHAIHMDQVFLMIPGYSGTQYSIPIKQNLLYMWFSYEIIQILNDDNQMYSIFFVPVMESRPNTHILDFGDNNRDRLICVEASQRLLSSPKQLMIILAHEIAHYVGDKVRLREKRKNCIIQVLASYVTDRLLYSAKAKKGSINNKEDLKTLDILIEQAKKEIQKSYTEYIENGIHSAFQSKHSNKPFYAEELRQFLTKASRKWLCEFIKERAYGSQLKSLLNKIDEKLQADNETYNRPFLYDLGYDLLPSAALDILLRDEFNSVINELIFIFRETFSDLVSWTILGCSEKDYVEAFNMSEGMIITPETKSVQQGIRQIMMSIIFSQSTDTVKTDNTPFYQGYRKIGEEIYCTPALKTQLSDYLHACHKELCKLIDKSDPSNSNVEKVRELYSLLQCDDGHFDNNFSNFYKLTIENIEEYKSIVKKKVYDNE